MTDRNQMHTVPDEERGIPSLDGKKRTRMNTVVFTGIALVAIILLASMAALYVKRLTAQKEAEKAEAAAKPRGNGQTVGTDDDLDGTKKRIKEQEEAQRVRAAAIAAAASQAHGEMQAPADAAANSTAAAQTAQTAQQGGSGKHVETQLERRLDGEVNVFGSDKGDLANVPSAADANGGSLLGGGAAAGGGSGKGPLDQHMAVSSLARAAVVKPGYLPDLNYLLKRGTMIPCSGSRMVSTYPGGTSCQLAQDVYSANGATLLLRKGAMALGEQQQALLQGQARMFAMYTRIDDGKITVPLDSPVTDSLGASGMPAYIERHFWERFGGALMVGLVSDFGQAIAQRSVGSNNSTISLTSTSQSTQDLANETLRNTINIPPTGYVNQGAFTYIYVARDIDFSSFYELVPAQGAGR
ncbi:Inner membrane protein forms channel for type IV secretion of T-DNA complex VirB10 (plasmid) [Burkholderia sp. KJ006]|uniref:TrbI/VirB10 family protein n=1 Tax=Burkholderia sp. KJ006 TaxID=416344 RepID=UPI00025F0E64|nr:TrbI/VirB10 family protein [Burkholderia sp. KJ006]AFJ90383.1 Inner membrane protein forms channel for type IV secretion of T-DNA complex VirB10 [Burkholderia sp. KJ006]